MKKKPPVNLTTLTKTELIRLVKSLERKLKAQELECEQLLAQRKQLAALKPTNAFEVIADAFGMTKKSDANAPDVQAAVNAACCAAIGDDCGVVHVKSSFPWQEPGDADNEPDTDGLSDAQ